MLKKLTIAIEQNNYPEFTKILDRLPEDNFQLNTLGEHGETLLGIAVERDRFNMVHLLLDRGVETNSADYALHQAVENENIQIIDLLLDSGADIDQINNLGCTPILLAANYGFEKIAVHLIKRGANIEIVNCLGLKPIHYALALQLTDTASMLETSVFHLLEERLFLESIYQPFKVIYLAASDIRSLIYRTCDTSIGDNYFTEKALESDLFSLIQYLSQLICSYLEIETSISTYNLSKSIDYYLHP